jgi:hypothetical protein
MRIAFRLLSTKSSVVMCTLCMSNARENLLIIAQMHANVKFDYVCDEEIKVNYHVIN